MKHESTLKKSFLAGADQPVSFAELFFDLVFVFSVTQVVHLLHGSFDWTHVGRAILVFWLVWWAWTQFTWALNAADTTHHRIQFAILLATALAFFMAVSVPQAFGNYSFWFALTYVIVRSIGLIIYLWVSWPDPEMRSAVRTFAVISIAGLVAAIVGGIVGGEAQYWMWGLTILLDVLAATIGAGGEGWNLHPRHFAERHGLFVIIALGETLIVAAAAASEEVWELNLLSVSAVAVGITSVLWWLYFFKVKDKLEHALAHVKGGVQSAMGRDVFSLLHFPMICGLIIYAYAIEEAMLQPSGPMAVQGRLALAAGTLLYTLSIVLCYWRAMGMILWWRIIFSIGMACVVVALKETDVLYTLLICFSGLLMLCILEEKIERTVAD
jgi:low temperature requirement protein LtrA